MLSVERVRGSGRDPGVFEMILDESFLATLDDEELRAAVAHELGHVWIFSHHPYLHTERLANEIAIRVVHRESLEKLYHKLWTHLGKTASIEEFLPPEKSSAR
jgi:hypothetical protein